MLFKILFYTIKWRIQNIIFLICMLQRLRFSLNKHADMFGVLPSGDIILKKHLDYESEDTYIFQVFATDGVQVQIF